MLILSFGESAIELEMRFWIADAQHGVHNVKSEVLYEVWRVVPAGRHSDPLPQAGFVCSFHRDELRSIATGCKEMLDARPAVASAALARGGTDDASPSSDGFTAT